VTTQLTLDANASDCASTSGLAKPGFHSLGSLRGNSVSRGPLPHQSPNRLPAELAFAGLLLAGFLGRYARKFRSAAWIILLAAAGLAMTACGSSSTSTTVPNPAKGTYTLTLSAQDSVTASISSTTTLTLTID
jgi:hypothetical protein